jgi:hypothetical protein
MIPVLMKDKGRIFSNSEPTITQTGQNWAYNIWTLNHRYELFMVILVVSDMKYTDGPGDTTSVLCIAGVHFPHNAHSNKSILSIEFDMRY